MTHTQAIELYQPTLQAIAYKMLGCMADAEDAVQEAFAKWLTVDTSKIQNAKSYLIRMVTNTCLNILNQRKNLRSIDADLVAEEIEDQERQRSLFYFDLDNQISEAWSFLSRKLEPLERAVFVLREVFDVDYEDLQFIVGRKAENCRKIVSRAKAKLKNTELPKVKISLPDHKLLDSLKAAFSKGHLSQLIHDFSFELFKRKS